MGRPCLARATRQRMIDPPQPLPLTGANRSELNRCIGARIRERRESLGLTQLALARRAGLKSQQKLHKYERGYDSVSAGALYRLASSLETSVDYFFEGLWDGTPPELTARERALLELMRALNKIESEAVRNVIAALIRALATDSEPASRER